MIDSTSVPAEVAGPPDLRRARRQKTVLAEAVKVDRLPPHSVEAEQGVLGCILLSPREGLGYCIERFGAAKG